MDDLNDKERPHYAELLRLLGEVDGWVARIDPGAERPRPAAVSPLHADDERAHPYELSHAAWHSLSHAVDHLNCLQTLLRDARVIHMYAPYSLVRSALENASAAVWMLHPASRPLRVARRLRLAMTDIRSGEHAKQLIGKVGPRSQQERIDDLHEIAKRAGVDEADVKRTAGYGEIVEAAGNALNPGAATMILFSWRLCSGIAHGDLWSTFTGSERVELPGAEPGLGTFKITANVERLMFVTTFATHMTEAGWRLYYQRSSAPY